MKTYTLYKLTNTINGKVYIGLTSVKPKRRWKGGCGYEHHSVLYADIKKYGFSAFKTEILETDLNKTRGGNREKYYIKLYDATNEEKGYNVQSGGFSKTGTARFSERSKVPHGKFSDEHRQHLSEAHKNQKPTEQQNMTNRLSNPRRKIVVCDETGANYPSIRFAGKITGIDHRRIREVCIGERKSAGGYHWHYKEGR